LLIGFLGQINPLDKYCLVAFPDDKFRPIVMPGLDPGIHALRVQATKDVDGRDKPGHDATVLVASNGMLRRNALPCGSRIFLATDLDAFLFVVTII
jgi:hypothetical protein